MNIESYPSREPGVPSAGGSPLTNRIGTKLFVACCLAAIVGCGYGEVSQTSYEISQALYKVCNQQQADKLDTIETLIEERLAAGEITAKEADWLRDIVADARTDNWDRAAKKARRMMTDQVNTREPATEPHRHAG